MGEKQRRFITKVISACIKWLSVAMFILVLIIFIQMARHPDQPPQILGLQGLTVLSNSMNPTFQTGDLVIVKAMDALDVNKNDIITFKENDGPYITHRVIDIVDEKGAIGFITKGDNNNVADQEIVHAHHLLGQVAFHIPYLGYIANFIGSKAGFILLILLPLVGYIALELNDKIGKNNNKKGVVNEYEQ
ncbi:signal peptidase I [Virgibacillus halodenitrificans]|uniref:signal peptidase I n=1 Tax=Virgibacillus halodenitrificans TaxID=1482 RepID=UPI000760DAE8|nr:signal peptidase I [Virgibacillus halodenitrificans]